MSLFETLAPHLPYLRRFARALTGSGHTGDNYVRSALEAMVAGEAHIDPNIDPKLALYKMFVTIWNTTGAQLESKVAGTEASESTIHRLTPLPRQVFLLKAMEGMAISEIAKIVGKTDTEVSDLISEAEAEIANELRTNVLIIEDEPIIAADLEGLVEELGHSVDSVAATHSEAVKAAAKKKPGIVLADVQLADGSSGIEAVEEILQSYEVPVIFITAFPERLLTGKNTEPTYLISKPFKPENVKAAISQALYFHGKEEA